MDKVRKYVFDLLRWSERYTKTDMVYLVKGGFWLGGGQIVVTLSAFLMSIAFANLLSPDAYGIYKFVLSINSLLLVTTLSGMDSAVTQSISRGFDGTLELGMKEKMKWGFLGSVLSLFISLYYFINGNELLSISFAIVSIFLPFTESMDSYNSLLWGKKLFNVQVKYNVINNLIILVGTTSVLFLTKNLYFVLFTYLLTMTLPNLFFIWRTKKVHKTNNEVDTDAVRYGKKLSLIGILALVFSQLDKVLVFHYIGAANLAIYSLAVAPTDQIKGLLKNVNAMAMPQLSGRTMSEIKNAIWNKINILFFAITSIVLVYIILAPLFFKTFFPKYMDSVVYSQILSLSLIPVVLAGFLYTIMESQKAEKEIYKHDTYGNIFGIIVLLPLVYYYGIWGAIYSRIVTRLFLAFYSFYLINKLK